jgi:CRISPR-associated endonuclease/helicase Cas3
MTEFSSCDLYSHPGKKLRDHLTAVATYCESTHQSANPDFSSLGYTNEKLLIFSRTLGLCHDFGKATTYFQKYLLSDENEKKRLKLKVKETQHGHISAIFTYHCLKEILKTTPDSDNTLLPFIGYVLVRHHHGDLKNFCEETTVLRGQGKYAKDIEILKNQSIDLKKGISSLQACYRELIPENILSSFFSDFEGIQKSIITDGKLFNLKPKLEKISDDTIMEIFTLFYYSLLLAGDKLDAAELSPNKKQKELRSDLVDRYREESGYANPSTLINRIRNEIYVDVISKVQKIDLNKRIYSLNVPTGTGKTLTAVSFALKLRERISRETKENSHIIYCLPFLSIIDQNYDVIESLFLSTYGDHIPSDILLKHHHLADITYTTDDDDYEENAARLLIEGWHSEFIITTFVQFFHTIISNRNSAVRKYHTLANAIVILDEVQSIPHEYWLLFHDIIQTLTKCLKMHVIFVTATQPLIFDEQKEEIIELASNKNIYFSQLDRVNLTFNKNPRTLQEFIEEICTRISTESKKSFLIVLNTINTAKETYTKVSSFNEPNTEYLFLSTHIIPKERLERIRKIRDPTNNKRKIIVSTQLVEAGVDIDVDIVYRDMAPLDSINQVAGRCNRNDRLNSSVEHGEVQIATLIDNGKKYCSYIYSQFLLDKTQNVLEGKTVINEQQFLELNNHYFRLVEESHSNDSAKKCLDLIRFLKYADLQEAFQLIKNDYSKIDVFIECDDVAHQLWNNFIDIKSKSFRERGGDFLKIKKEFLEHVISVPKNKAQNLFREDVGIGYISCEELKKWYNPETGFISNES